jgi:4-carboxymuconolactone decarboxylase
MAQHRRCSPSARAEHVPPAAGQQFIDALGQLAPDLAPYVIEIPFGDVYSRPGLNLRAREIATVAAPRPSGTPARD